MSTPGDSGAAKPNSAWIASPPRWGRADALALAVWTLAVAVVFRDAVVFGRALFYFDITELNLPYRAYLAREASSGRLSFWLPHLYCGMPLFSESQAGYFHPLKWLLYPWMATWRAFNLDTVGSVWLAGLGAYGWLRRHVGSLGALTGAAIVGLGGYSWAHLIHTSMINALASVPLAVWALESAWDGGRWRAAALGGLALAAQVFAGHLQDTILTGSALGLYTLLRALRERSTRARLHVLGTAAAMVVLCGLVSAVQWMPSKELLDRSPRAGGLTWNDMTYGSWHPQLLPTLLLHEAYGTRARDTDWMDGYFPYHEMDAYLGVIGLFLAAIGMGAWRDRWVGTWVILGAIGALLMLGRYTALMDFLHRVPIVGSSRIPVRYHLWVTLAVAALAAVGVDRLTWPGRVRLLGPSMLLLVMLLASIVILILTYRPAYAEAWRWTQSEHRDKFAWLGAQIAAGAAINTTLFVIALAAAGGAARSPHPRTRARWTAILPVLAMADMGLAHRDDVPTVPSWYWSEPPKSVAALKSDPTFLRVYGEKTYSSGEPGHASKPIDFTVVRETIAWSLPAAWDVLSTGGETPILSTRRVRFGEWHAPTRYDLEGLSHILSTTPSVERLGPAEKVGAAYLHKNPRVLPRARFVGRPVYATDERNARDLLIGLGVQAAGRVVVEDPDRPMAASAEASGRARVAREVPDRVEVEATAGQGGGYLLLSDTFDPGWTATVDGRPTPVRPANIAFRAVFLPPGSHRVVFRYWPRGMTAGLALTGVGLAAALVLLVRKGRAVDVRPEHGTLAGRPLWPIALAAFAASVLIGSSIRVTPKGRIAPQERWEDSFRPFTWGAKIEAIKPPPPPIK